MNRRMFLSSALAVPVASSPAAPDWVSLFDGKTLTGWDIYGSASWLVDEGCLVGRQGPGGAAGDIFTTQRWKDFEVEAEWRMRWPGNSGLWFRWSGEKTGYQADFLEQGSHPGVLSGSLYCMGKAFIAENRDASSVNREGWNRLSIRAVGADLEITQNGKKIINLRDDAFPGPGSIGVQVHAGEQFTGMEVRLRNLRLRNL